MKKAFIFVAVLIVAVFFVISLNSSTYYVKSISSHYPHSNDNSETTVIVWNKGKQGHVKKVLCAFPPETKLRGNNSNGWTGIEKIKIGKKYKTYLFGKISYLCDIVK